jgi:hypothetical protein
MLGAWMGVPIVWSEYVAGVGSCLLIVAAYLTLFEGRTGAVFAAVGSSATAPFWLIETVKALRADGRSITYWTILFIYILVVGVCGARVLFELRRNAPRGVGRRRRRSIVGVSAVLLVCLLAAGEWQHIKSERHPCRYVVPDGYVGWVVIHFNHPSAPIIELKDKELLFDIPESGVLYTKSQQEFGEAQDRYFYKLPSGRLQELPDTSWGKGGMVWDESSGTTEKPGAPDDHREQFFIGTEQQEKAMQNLSNTWDGIVPGDLRTRLR